MNFKKIFKSSIATVLSIGLISGNFSILPTDTHGMAFADEGDDQNSSVKWEIKNGKLTILSTGKIPDYGWLPGLLGYKSKAPWGKEDNITEVEMSEGITSIGNYAFAYLGTLKKVTVPSTLTKIGQYAFSGCSVLESIILPDSLESIGYSAFYDCAKLEKVTIPNSLKKIGDYAFGKCPMLKSITLPRKGVEIGNKAFDDGVKIYYRSGELNDKVNYKWDETSKKLTISGTGKIPNYDYGNEFTSLEIEKGITSIEVDAFKDSKISEVKIPDSVTSIKSNAFGNCTNLRKITMSIGTEIDDKAFPDSIKSNKETSIKFIEVEEVKSAIAALTKEVEDLTLEGKENAQKKYDEIEEKVKGLGNKISKQETGQEQNSSGNNAVNSRGEEYNKYKTDVVAELKAELKKLRESLEAKIKGIEKEDPKPKENPEGDPKPNEDPQSQGNSTPGNENPGSGTNSQPSGGGAGGSSGSGTSSGGSTGGSSGSSKANPAKIRTGI